MSSVLGMYSSTPSLDMISKFGLYLFFGARIRNLWLGQLSRLAAMPPLILGSTLLRITAREPRSSSPPH